MPKMKVLMDGGIHGSYILDGSSELGAHVWSDLAFFYMIKEFVYNYNSHKSELFSTKESCFPLHVRIMFYGTI